MNKPINVIAKEHKQKKQKRHYNSSSAKKATPASVVSSNKWYRSTIYDSGESTNENENEKKKETTKGDGRGIKNKVRSTVTEIDPVEARAIVNRAWSAFIEKWSVVRTKMITTTRTIEVALSPL